MTGIYIGTDVSFGFSTLLYFFFFRPSHSFKTFFSVCFYCHRFSPLLYCFKSCRPDPPSHIGTHGALKIADGVDAVNSELLIKYIDTYTYIHPPSLLSLYTSLSIYLVYPHFLLSRYLLSNRSIIGIIFTF